MRSAAHDCAALFLIFDLIIIKNMKEEKEDDAFTKRISYAGRLMGIKLIDHIIIGAYSGYYSYSDEKNPVLQEGN